MLIGEIWIPDAVRLARYVSPGELHTVFNFPYLSCPWDAAQLREVIDNTLALNAPVGAPATWVLSNHDVDRIVSRLRPVRHRVQTCSSAATFTAFRSISRSARGGPGRPHC